MDAILGDPASPFYLGRAARVHLLLGGEDYPDLADRFRSGGVVAYGDHSDAFINEIGDSLRSLPRIFVNVVLPRLPALDARLRPARASSISGVGPDGRSSELAERLSRPAGSTARTSSRAPSSWRLSGSRAGVWPTAARPGCSARTG